MSAQGLIRCSIQNLTPHLTNALVVGQLIAKSDVNLFHRSNNKYGGQQNRNNHQPTASTSTATIDADGESSLKGVLTLTIRDSDRGIINCTVWGRETLVQTYALRFHLGDLLSVQRPTVELCKTFDAYHPLTPSPYRLTVNDGQGDACVVSASMLADAPQLDRMLSMPVKSTAAALRLADVGAGITLDSLALGGGSRGERFVDLLVVVQKMGAVKSLGADKKFGKGERMMRNVDVMDESASAVRLTIWNTGFVKRSHAWTEMSTVLQLIDVRIAPSAFRRCMELSTHGRTLIVEASRTRDVHRLQQYARTVLPLVAVERWNASSVDLAAIRTVMSVAQVLDHVSNEFHVLMFVVVTALDLDGSDGSVVVRRCAHCQRMLRQASGQCGNEDCMLMGSVVSTTGAAVERAQPRSYDIRVELTDHSGTLACRLRTAAAERLLGCAPEDWLCLSERQRGQIKWRWLMERCAVKLCVQHDTGADGQPFNCAEMVDCELADDERVTREIKYY